MRAVWAHTPVYFKHLWRRTEHLPWVRGAARRPRSESLQPGWCRTGYSTETHWCRRCTAAARCQTWTSALWWHWQELHRGILKEEEGETVRGLRKQWTNHGSDVYSGAKVTGGHRQLLLSVTVSPSGFTGFVLSVQAPLRICWTRAGLSRARSDRPRTELLSAALPRIRTSSSAEKQRCEEWWRVLMVSLLISYGGILSCLQVYILRALIENEPDISYSQTNYTNEVRDKGTYHQS